MNNLQYEINDYLQALKSNILVACWSFNSDIRQEEINIITTSYTGIQIKFKAGNYSEFLTEVVNLYDYLNKTSDAFYYCCTLLEAIKIRIPDLASTVIKESLPDSIR